MIRARLTFSCKPGSIPFNAEDRTDILTSMVQLQYLTKDEDMMVCPLGHSSMIQEQPCTLCFNARADRRIRVVQVIHVMQILAVSTRCRKVQMLAAFTRTTHSTVVF